MNFANVKSLSIPDGIAIKIDCGTVKLWEAITYKNWAHKSFESDGTTIFNGGKGYKDNYRLNSSGVEKEESRRITGFIPCKAGDVIRFKYTNGFGVWTENSVFASSFNFYNASKSHLGQLTSQPANYGIVGANEYKNVVKSGDTWTYTVMSNSDIAFIRITVPYYTNDPATGVSGDKLVITINEEIT